MVRATISVGLLASVCRGWLTGVQNFDVFAPVFPINNNIIYNLSFILTTSLILLNIIII